MAVRSLQPAPRGFHGDSYLLKLVETLAQGAQLFIETGSNAGSTLGDVAKRYPHLACFACEPNAEAFAAAEAYAATRQGVEIFQETSQEFLSRLDRAPSTVFEAPLLAWLDAHGYGYEWPLREEVEFLTSRFTRGAILIDDFQVPGLPEFGWDQYDGHLCNFDYVESAISDSVAYRLSYPAYSEHTSPWHPLRGWGLLQFAPTLEELPDMAALLPEVCAHAKSREPISAAKSAGEPLDEAELDAAIETLRAMCSAEPDSALAHNDLGVCMALRGDTGGAIAALGTALNIDPQHPDATVNLRDLARAQTPAGMPEPPTAPGLSGSMVRRDPYQDMAHLVDQPAPLIVDGGANRGDTVARVRSLFPEASIHAFEPIPDLCDGMRARFASDDRLTVHAAALADQEGSLEFEVRAADVMSSMLVPSALKLRYQGARAESVGTVATLKRRLDQVFREPIDILKLDLQGAEIAAMKGAGALLAETRVVLTEVEFAPLYVGQPLFADVDQFMRAAGFRLFNLYDLWSHPDGQLTAGDAVYVNERQFS